MIVDGKKIAAEIREELRVEISKLGFVPRLGFIRTGDDLVAQKFVEMKSRTAQKLGVEVEEFLLPANADTKFVVDAVEAMAARTHGMLVQMPLSPAIDTEEVLRNVPIEKDVDAMGMRSGQLVLTPVVGAFAEIVCLEHYELSGKKAVVVGVGKLVGLPAIEWLRKAGAEVTLLTQKDGELAPYTKQADIIVLGAGKPGILTPDMIKPGVVIFDASTSESDGALKGDADPACADLASMFTPVPGGIGPIAIVMIFKNLLTLKKLQR